MGAETFASVTMRTKFPFIAIQLFNNESLNFIIRIRAYCCNWHTPTVNLFCSQPIYHYMRASIILRTFLHISISKPLNLSDYSSSHSLEYHFALFSVWCTANINNKAWFRNGKKSKGNSIRCWMKINLKNFLLDIFSYRFFYGLARSEWKLSK
jgi:hypothetical protein